MEKQVQVTIMIQDGDKLTTIKIPVAQDVNFETRTKAQGRLYYDEATHYAPQVADVSLNLQAFFDPKKGHIYSAETDTWTTGE